MNVTIFKIFDDMYELREPLGHGNVKCDEGSVSSHMIDELR